MEKDREQIIYEKSIPILQYAAKLYKEDANKAVEYIIENMKKIQKETEL